MSITLILAVFQLFTRGLVTLHEFKFCLILIWRVFEPHYMIIILLSLDHGGWKGWHIEKIALYRTEIGNLMLNNDCAVLPIEYVACGAVIPRWKLVLILFVLINEIWAHRLLLMWSYIVILATSHCSLTAINFICLSGFVLRRKHQWSWFLNWWWLLNRGLVLMRLIYIVIVLQAVWLTIDWVDTSIGETRRLNPIFGD